MSKSTATFTRDQFTWLTYLGLGYYSYLLNGLGPVMPFLRAELHLSYTLSSIHFSAFAIGMIVAGLSSDRLVRRFGRRRTFWAGALGMMGGVLLLLIGIHPILTTTGALVMGTVGSFLIVIIPSALSDRYGVQRAVALSEANVVASLCGGLAPVIIGLFARGLIGWRGALLVPVLTILVLRFRFGQILFPESPTSAPQQAHSQQKLPGIYWVYWILLVFSVAVEFCMIFWSSTFLETERHLARADAALAVSIFLSAMVLGRWLGSRLSRQYTSEKIVIGSAIVCLGGFLLYWWAASPVLTMCGLFIAGLGVANLYPQMLALAVGIAPNLTDVAMARASLASGMAVLSLPLLLGGLADHIGIWLAYGVIVPLLLTVGLGTWGLRYAEFLRVKTIGAQGVK